MMFANKTAPRFSLSIFALACSTVFSGCTTPPVVKPSVGHLTAEDNTPKPAAKSAIPSPVTQSVALPRPKPAAKTETYSVSVRNVPVDELLFALARDAKLNIDLHPGVTGAITINAIDQTLQQILTRIGKQVDMRWELDGPNLAVMSDTPFLRVYKVDYVNMSRDVSGTVAINTQIASAGSSGTGGSGGGNNSSTTVNSRAKNHFWESLESNIKDMLHETDKILPDGSSETVVERTDSQTNSGISALTGSPLAAGVAAVSKNMSNAVPGAQPTSSQQAGNTVIKRSTFREAASVIVNPEAGLVLVRATARQHEKVQEYVDQVTTNSRRQVMIEATIVEVGLSNQYEQGIDWSIMPTGSAGTKLSVSSSGTGMTVGSYTTATDPNSAKAGVVLKGLGVISGSLKMLENFGTVKVLSSPKISVLNNQTAMLKVVNNYVYFSIASNTTTSSSSTQTTVTTTPNSVSIGLVMSVTPQIGENNVVLLNVRPTISSLYGLGKKDPNPSIPAGLENVVPEIQTREMESMLRLNDGETAIMGGLMEDKITNGANTIPGLGSLPTIGALFGSTREQRAKTELVVFLRPTIIRDPSINGDYQPYRHMLPTKDFLVDTNVPTIRKAKSIEGSGQ